MNLSCDWPAAKIKAILTSCSCTIYVRIAFTRISLTSIPIIFYKPISRTYSSISDFAYKILFIPLRYSFELPILLQKKCRIICRNLMIDTVNLLYDRTAAKINAIHSRYLTAEHKTAYRIYFVCKIPHIPLTFIQLCCQYCLVSLQRNAYSANKIARYSELIVWYHIFSGYK